MRILAVGGTGFIGSFLVPLLQARGHEVAVLHRHATELPSGVASIIGDRNNLQPVAPAIRDFKPEVIVDLILSSEAQATMAMHFFRGVARRYVALSSMDVYRAVAVFHGTEPEPLQPLPLTEQSELRRKPPYSPHALKALSHLVDWATDDYDKVPVERIVLGDAELPGTVLRLPAIYGPGDYLHRLWPYLKRMDDSRPFIILPEGSAQWRWTRGYVENVAAAVALAATAAAAGRVYNVGESEAFSELEWAQEIADVVGWCGRFLILPEERTPPHLRIDGNTAQHWVASSDLIRDELGYREVVSRQESLRRAVEWERAHPPEHPFPPLDYAAEDAVASAAAGA
ncbi:MAG TPA: NAD-dependent epimerase/dehydratase family protein [Terriglobales bacterium]|nr:NAD-dependent epimerase/dehydratase family protein [Terriglobales bacterium]